MQKYKILNSNELKLVAIIAMTVDHIAWAMFDGYPTAPLPIFMHIIGRLTCPIMCYFIAEGYHYTKNINKYTFRLFAFAFISHFAYIFASNAFVDFKSFIPFYYGDFLNQTSVMWSLAWGLVMLRIADSKKVKLTCKVLLVILICIITLPSDWSCIASLCIMAIGTNRDNLKKQMAWMIFYVALYSLVYFFAIDKVYGVLQMGVILSIPIIAMYNGSRGKNEKINKFMKWFFYWFYVGHLVLCGLIRVMM